MYFMKKALLKLGVASLFLSLSLIGLSQKSFASENKFCLENDGYITPIIPNEPSNCSEIIDIKEFKKLISLDLKDRKKELQEFRKLAKGKPEKENALSNEDVKKATKELITKNTLEQKRLKRLADAKQKRIENQKKILEKKTTSKKDKRRKKV